MRLRTLTLLVAVSFAMLLALNAYLKRGATTSGDKPVQVYFADHISPAHLAVIQGFNSKFAGRIEVIPVDLPFDKFSTNERKELLARSLRSKSEKLDVFAVDLIWVSRFARWSEPLSPYFSLSEQQGLLESALRSCVVGDTLLAMPMYIDIGLMYYRRDLIRKLSDGAEVERRLLGSITWDEWASLSRRLGYGSKPSYVFAAKEYEGLVCSFLELAVGNDQLYLSRNDLDLSSPAAYKSLQTLVEFVRSGASPREVVGFDENQSYRWFLDNDALFVRGWPNFVENFRRFYSDTAKLENIGRAPLPHAAGQRPSSVFGGWNLMVSRSSAKKREAVEFIRYIQSPEAQRMMFELGGYIPIQSGLYRDSTLLASHPELSFYHGLLQRGFHRPMMVDYTRASDIASHFLHRAITGELSVAEALVRANDMIRSNAPLLR